MPGDTLHALTIRSSNLNDIFEKATINVTFTRVKSPGKIFRERYWDMPDQFVMSKNEYETYFPYDVYKDEDKIQNWPLAEKLVDRSDSTKENGNWELGVKGWAAGWYKIVATTKDKYGEDVKAEKFIRITDQRTTNNDQPLSFDATKQTAEPGESITYSIRSGFSNVWAIQVMQRMGNSGKPATQNISSVVPIQSAILVTESDRGGIGISYAFVKHNRVYSGAENFDIPWSNKDLNISYETFRDKLLPGSQENWKLKITGNKGEKIAAEMLAGMYDASLDQFKPHGWNKISIWPGLYNIARWEENGFEKTESEEYDKTDYEFLRGVEKNYDRLLSYYDAESGGLVYRMKSSNDQSIRIRGMASVGNLTFAAAAPPEINQVKFTPPKVVKDKEVKLDDAIADSAQTSNLKPQTSNDAIQIRKNFNETAFFFPDLKTDADGNVEFSFTMPEALTKWKLMTLAHTKNVASGYSTNTTITQKPLMVQPNAPRFMREGDKMEFSAKIVNLGDSEVTGIAQLELIDAATNKPVDGWFKNVFPNQYFTVAAGQSEAVKFPMEKKWPSRF